MHRPSIIRIDRRTKSACHRLNGPAKATTERRQKTEKKEYINYNNSVGVPFSLLLSFAHSCCCQCVSHVSSCQGTGLYIDPAVISFESRRDAAPTAGRSITSTSSSCDFASSFGCTLSLPLPLLHSTLLSSFCFSGCCLCF